MYQVLQVEQWIHPEVPELNIIKQYNTSTGAMDRLDQNINPLRICIKGKKWHLLCCDLAPGQSSSKCLTAASEKCWESVYPELQEGDHLCHPEGLGRGPHLDPLWGPDFVVIQQNIHQSASTRDVRLGARPVKSATEVSVLTISRNTTLQLRPNLSGLHMNYAEPTDIVYCMRPVLVLLISNICQILRNMGADNFLNIHTRLV
jgi:hypothetical protein